MPVTSEDSTEAHDYSIEESQEKTPNYYSTQETDVDSYLIPPNQHTAEVSLPDTIVTPATYLLPPLANSEQHYYVPTEPSMQSDWYPIVQALPKIKSTQSKQNSPESDSYTSPLKDDKESFDDSAQYVIQIPSRRLQPPLDDRQNAYYIRAPASLLERPVEINQEFVPGPTRVLQRPLLEQRQKFRPATNKVQPNHAFDTVEPTLALHLVPPSSTSNKFKNPTKLYPKKYGGGFKPIPIPISQYSDGNDDEIPKAIPVKPFKPIASSEEAFLSAEDEKKLYLFEQAELKRKLKDEEAKKVLSFEFKYYLNKYTFNTLTV